MRNPFSTKNLAVAGISAAVALGAGATALGTSIGAAENDGTDPTVTTEQGTNQSTDTTSLTSRTDGATETETTGAESGRTQPGRTESDQTRSSEAPKADDGTDTDTGDAKDEAGKEGCDKGNRPEGPADATEGAPDTAEGTGDMAEGGRGRHGGMRGGDGATSDQAPTTTESGDAANTSMRGGAVTMQDA